MTSVNRAAAEGAAAPHGTTLAPPAGAPVATAAAMRPPLEAVAGAWAERVGGGLAEALGLAREAPPPAPAAEELLAALSDLAAAGAPELAAAALAERVAERLILALQAAVWRHDPYGRPIDVAPARLAAVAAPICQRLVAGRARLARGGGPATTAPAPTGLWLGGLGELLWRAVLPLLAPTLRRARATAGSPPPLACRAYRPSLQLAALGFAGPGALLGPVLDLGCGPAGALAGHLRDHGVQAVGLDREVPDGAPAWVRQGDWLALPRAAPVWGTVVSHLGFSLHFLRQHLRSAAGAAAYARALMRLLGALLPGGRLALVPALPFFEPLLSAEEVRIEHHPLPAELAGQPALQALQARLGLGLGHATHIVRR